MTSIAQSIREAAAEREACASTCERIADELQRKQRHADAKIAQACADAIREEVLFVAEALDGGKE